MIGDTPEPARMRRDYGTANALSPDGLAGDWWVQFDRWFADAVDAGLPEPNAMIVATADPHGRPSARTVLLKGYDERGLVFYTNYESRKGVELAANPYASLVLPWFAMRRQIVVAGSVSRVSRAETEAYWATRPRESQLGAWASPQSQVVADRATLDRVYEETERRFPEQVPAPEHWGGLRVAPHTVEFWQGRTGRLHDRLRYRRTDEGVWIIERLAP
ncbi:pyridoxamine 5'-phosphate oxidase [Phytohabitans houttuyneae]|uniref:Pyridoxine/pyridoxamine 5'-phosphate oxidase n=2 Tax=Phytohabitans houttuyneae TaxID=1076126 RepID=A0A6V8K9N0_9ACTN|nr:pyridoxine/pyridoxamine 5'-phosphate oxidase [Phytohabitans houttuyneae]